MRAEADATSGFEVRPESVAAPGDDLVGRARGGDDDAFAQLYRWAQPPLLRYLRVLTGSAAVEAEDIAAETWLHACRDLTRFRGGQTDFLAWLLRIGRNRALDQFRRDGRRPALPVPAERLHPIPGPDDTEHQALTGVSTEAALALISSLPPEQAEAVMLRTVLGLDARSAARILAKRPGAVRMAAHRGLQALAAKLSAGEGE